jgi:hypothetical protein
MRGLCVSSSAQLCGTLSSTTTLVARLSELSGQTGEIDNREPARR